MSTMKKKKEEIRVRNITTSENIALPNNNVTLVNWFNLVYFKNLLKEY